MLAQGIHFAYFLELAQGQGKKFGAAHPCQGYGILPPQDRLLQFTVVLSLYECVVIYAFCWR